MRRRFASHPSAVLLFLLVFAVCTGAAATVFGRTWYVKPDGTGDAPTIQAAVDAASPGDVVLVAAGTYSNTKSVNIAGFSLLACVEISKEIKLTSESGPSVTTLGAPNAQLVIYVHNVSSEVEISGFRIQSKTQNFYCLTAKLPPALSPEPITDPRGISCQDGSVRIVGNYLLENEVGIELIRSAAIVSDNTLERAVTGIGCYQSASVVIEHNVVHNCGRLLECEGSAPAVSNNDFYDCCDGIDCALGSAPTISGNTIHDAASYAVSCGGSSVTIVGNRFTSNNAALLLRGMTGPCLVQGNVFYDQIVGLSLSDNSLASIVIEANTIDLTQGGAAILCQASSSPTIRRNIIVNSGTGIRCSLSSFPQLACNDLFSVQQRYAGDCADQTGINGNISADPQFCGITGSGNYSLQADSPCAPGNHPDGTNCGGIGSSGVACGPVSTKLTTWGAVKAKYR